MPKSTRTTGNGTVKSGTNGDDILSGLGGTYILSGGNGNDTYIVDDTGDQVDEKNNGGIDIVLSYIDWTLGQQVENLTLQGSADLSGTGNDSGNMITGNAGANALSGLGGNDTLDGGEGDDGLYGGAGDDTLTGGAGSDLIDGGSGSDTAVFAGPLGDYSLTWVGADLRVTNTIGETDILRGVEFLAFDGQVIAASDVAGGPVAVDDVDAGAEDSAIVIPVLSNDLGQGITVAAATNGAMGLVVVNTDGTVTYRPNANAYGTDSFTYTITDLAGRTSTASVTVEVVDVNDPPVAEADSYAAVAGEVFASAGSVLGNDTDADGDTLTVTAYDPTSAAGGTVQMNADGTFGYTPLAGFTGLDSFSYTVDDGNGGKASATVTLMVDPAVPMAADDSATVLEDGSVVISVLANDAGEALSITSASDGSIGSVVVNVDGTLTYTPLPDANGTDGFSYTITDSLGRASTAAVSVTVSPVNDAPLASADSFAATSGRTFSSVASVLDNDGDVDGHSLTIINYDVTTEMGGSVEMSANGTFTYTPASGFTGSDRFTYTVDDGNGGQASAFVNLTVEPAAAVPYYIEALLLDSARLNYPDSYGTADSVTFAFLGAVPDYYSASSWVHDQFQAFSEQQRTATRDALTAISNFANITFVEVASADQADITFGFADTGGFAGITINSSPDGVGNDDNDIWLTADAAGGTLLPGTSIYKTLLHEIGHALGMDHGSELPSDEQNRQHTVMSANAPLSLSYEPQTYMLFDVATLQYIYGPNTGYSTTDDVYAFSDLAGKLKTIWDAGGHDVLDLSAATYGVDISLIEGTFSTIDPWGSNNLAIVFGTVIEDAAGGAYADQITGNDMANMINGGGGNDLLTGRGGADTFAFGGNWGDDSITDFVRGEDLLDFSSAGLSFADLDIASSGGDTVISYAGDSVTLIGVAAIDGSDLLVA